MKLLPRVATRRLPVPLLLLLDLATAALQPMVIRKMSPDESEKFFPHYVAFPEDQLAAVSALQKRHHPEPAFSPSFPIHVDDPGSPSEDETLYRRAAAALARLQRRQWGCPAGTASCSNIGHPDRCCRQTETCYKIDDTGLGSVGCCANGSTCGGTISNCAPGDTACPASMGGGCCIAGFVCQGVGCVRMDYTSRTRAPTTTVSTSTAANGGGGGGGDGGGGGGGGGGILTSTIITTVVVTPPNGGSPTTVTSTFIGGGGGGGPPPSTTAPPPDTDTDTPLPPPPTSTGGGTGNAPVRPTVTNSDGFPSDYCPTGFYPCVARAGGGCCQTGRDCQTTNCPAPPLSTTIISNGVTVAVPLPTPNRGSDDSKTCAGGWYMCPDSAGPVAGCCPSGYDCGVASCTSAREGATATLQKEFPSSAATDRTPKGEVLTILGMVLVSLALLA
ncbi:hypothetical protein PoMZ_11391 [Pyricularia oryzae]|uniref:GPI anchored protein n=1 Tax=Pyricularia oryzae TaxID=318829 RepID=A0A4P7NKD7_PYROR|nr:hypothetical protein PoMZ_11391 [Pyricularia oryzae]